MGIKNKIATTETYKKLIESTPFLSGVLLRKAVTDSIERIVYQIEKLGENYISDKSYSDREVKIAKEIIELNKNAK
jgi:hypothetical protein